jgi:hypothetical protein
MSGERVGEGNARTRLRVRLHVSDSQRCRIEVGTYRHA